MTVVELLATTAFVAVALVGTAAAVLESSELGRVNAQTRAVSRTIAGLFEEVRGCPFDQVVTTYNGVTRTVTGIPDAPRGAQARFAVTDVPTGNTRWQVRKVLGTLTWGAGTGTRALSAVSYVSDRTTAAAPILALTNPSEAPTTTTTTTTTVQVQ
jgi:hypothetical protein